jgi:hypothetical protein
MWDAALGRLTRQCQPDGDSEPDRNAGYDIAEELHGNRPPVESRRGNQGCEFVKHVVNAGMQDLGSSAM